MTGSFGGVPEECERELRRGWTTGACATAATKAALTALLTGAFPDPVEIVLPKGERIHFPLAAANRDPKYYDDPEVFRPERFIASDGSLRDPLPDTHGYGHRSFGSGRRYGISQSKH